MPPPAKDPPLKPLAPQLISQYPVTDIRRLGTIDHILGSREQENRYPPQPRDVRGRVQDREIVGEDVRARAHGHEVAERGHGCTAEEVG